MEAKDRSFDELFDHIEEDVDYIPVDVKIQEIIILVAMPLFSLCVHYLLQEYDREDFDFFIGNAKTKARVNSVVWHLDDEELNTLSENDENFEVTSKLSKSSLSRNSKMSSRKSQRSKNLTKIKKIMGH